MTDIAAYLDRIGVRGARPAPTAASLCAIHFAHATAIPFENLDLLLGLPIRLDLPSLEAKLVRGGRGGYCFEQNALLAAALEGLGFHVVPLAARVRLGGRTDGPRTHMLLAVRADGRDFLADVGFGGGGLLEPLPIEPGSTVRQHGWDYRIVMDGPERVLQATVSGAWNDLYGFTLEPQLPSDYAVANHYTSTHPDSSFTRILTVQRPGPGARIVLRGDMLTESHPDGTVSEKKVEGGDELLRVLDETFGLRFPAGTRFTPLHPPEPARS